MKEPLWVPKNIVLAIHDELLFEHGGAPGIRDEDLLDSALSRPQNIQSYGKPNIFSLAASYINGIVRNHPFVDGNKRTAFMVGYVFLFVNGKELIALETEATEVMQALASKKMNEKEFSRWLKTNSK